MEQKNRRISTRQLVSMAMLGAISIVLVAVIHFPLIPRRRFWNMTRRISRFSFVPLRMARWQGCC